LLFLTGCSEVLQLQAGPHCLGWTCMPATELVVQGIDHAQAHLAAGSAAGTHDTNRRKPTPTFVDGSSALLHPGHALELDAQLVGGRHHGLRHVAGPGLAAAACSLLAEDHSTKGGLPLSVELHGNGEGAKLHPTGLRLAYGAATPCQTCVQEAPCGEQGAHFQQNKPGEAREDGRATGVFQTLQTNIDGAANTLTWGSQRQTRS
jgi:hypothetical protein